MYNGHQYAAVKLPSDAVCAFGNEFSLEYLSDYEDCITSPELESLAAEGGFAVYGRDGELNLLETYAGEEVLTDYSHRRTWIAHYKVYRLPVRAYWHEAETGMTQGMGQILEIAAGMEVREQAAGYITDYCNMMQMQAFSDAKQLLNDVRWYHSKNSNTLKNGRNPETGEVLDELKEIAPLEVTLAPDTYFSIPDIGGEQDLSAPTVANVSIQHEEEFGGVYIELAIDEFNALGYAYGDSVTVTFSNGYTLESIPYYNGYYTQTGEPLLVAYPGYPYIKACVNNGDDLWLLAELRENVTAEIALAERGAYLDIQEARDIHYEDDRDLFLSDEVFANFRSVTCGDIQENRLYRSASPCDNQHNRASYVDALIADAGVDQILDLADNEEKIQGYLSEQDFSSPYFLSLYEEGGVIPLSLNMNFSSDEFREKVATGLSALAEHPGSWLVHCTEGKDRTGFVCMLLEALCGASYEEIVSDYMITYDNYYGIASQSDPARYEVIVENVLDPMILCVIGDSSADPASVDLSESAARYLEDAGMSREQVAALREALTAEP